MLNVPAHWRIPPSFLEVSPFGAGEHGRPFRVIVDHPTLQSSPELRLLADFCRRPGVEIFSTYPTSERRVEIAVVASANDALEVRYVLPEGSRTLALFAASSWDEHARIEAEECGLDQASARAGLLLALASAQHQVDALVTEAEILAVPRWRSHAAKGRVMSEREACALLGLFLRAHNDFTVKIDGNHATFLPFERFYRGVAIAGLPAYPRWLHVAWTAWREGRGPELFGLLRAVDARVGRALIARDYVSVRVRHWRPDETWDEVLYFFESFLLSLHGAVDAFARFLHLALGLPRDVRSAGFGRRDWRKSVVSHGPAALAELVQPQSSFTAVVEMVGIIRNFVHAEVLDGELLRDDGGVPAFIDYGKGVLALHGEAADRLSRATGRAGGPAPWGIADGLDGAITLMPIMFLREALTRTLAGLRDVMEIPIDGVLAGPLAEPFDATFWIPTLEYSESLLLLTGLGPTSPRLADASE